MNNHKGKIERKCVSCVPKGKWNFIVTVGYLVYGALMILPAFFVETWLLTLTGFGMIIAVSLVAPIVEESLKALPILFGYTDDWNDRLKFIIIVGFMFGVAEWILYFFTQDRVLTFGFLLHILFMLPLFFFYSRDNKFGNLVGLGGNILLHMAWNVVVLTSVMGGA